MVTCSGDNFLMKIFIFIFFLDILLSILSSALSSLPVDLRSRISQISRIWLALCVTLCVSLSFLDQLPLWFHQLTQLFAAFRRQLSPSLNCVGFRSSFWIRIANSFAGPLPTIRRRFGTNLAFILGSVHPGLQLLCRLMVGELLQVTLLIVPLWRVRSLDLLLWILRFENLLHVNKVGLAIRWT